MKRDARKVVSCSFSQSIWLIPLISWVQRNIITFWETFERLTWCLKSRWYKSVKHYTLYNFCFFLIIKEYDWGIYVCIHETSYCYTLSNLWLFSLQVLIYVKDANYWNKEKKEFKRGLAKCSRNYRRWLGSLQMHAL